MKKILLVVTQSDLGGAQRYVAILAHFFAQRGDDVSVAAGGNKNGKLLRQLDAAGIKTFHLSHLVRNINPLQDIRAIFELSALCKKLKPSVVHLNSSKAGVVGSIAAHRAGVPTVLYTAHGFVFNEPLPAWKKFLYIIAERYTAKFKTKIICVSQRDQQTAAENAIAPAEKLIVIHNGVEPAQLLTRQEARSKLGLPADKFIIGSIASFYPTKGIDHLIDAMAILKKQQIACLLALIGNGPQRSKIETKISRLELTDTVLLLGQHEEAEKLLLAFDIFVLPSVKEGLPFSLLDAMAAGVPVVATAVGGIGEVIQNGVNGFLVEPANPSALAIALSKLSRDMNNTRALATRAQKDTQNNFSQKQMLERTSQLYR
ncbi:MAG: hypothetical protein A2840_01045 [Candidatus Buchananbacteria bacterium RIFCSPHIGHO2_01_FULL_47_11b]|uniref:Glycosyl transferase family 1 n=1 Tax=Candidatus Buchananbacteria bacterium RIFCSPHIGHO2_01_FULL_47_11b TaxID=1797537 RepID=A0A1G1Y5Z6_9BACT|nr:MAG: hypothetical protein A2840_01045 [Candidatus Buchananbacteria bacterium RIFCSPHIGHO2_01_FULL_47_11b]